MVPSRRGPQILVANDNACRLLGYSSHDLIGQELTQFFLRPDSDVVEALSEEHVEADGRAAVVFGSVVSAAVRGRSLGAPAALPVGVGSRGGRHRGRRGALSSPQRGGVTAFVSTRPRCVWRAGRREGFPGAVSRLPVGRGSWTLTG